MDFNEKHFSLEDRKIIKHNICKRLTKFKNPKKLSKSQFKWVKN